MKRYVKYGRLFVLSAVLLFASCAGQYSDDPEVKSLQVWADTCYSYTQTLKAINDMIEVEILVDEDQISIVRHVRNTVGPLCEQENPPLTGDRKALQELIDAELLKLIKVRKGLE